MDSRDINIDISDLEGGNVDIKNVVSFYKKLGIYSIDSSSIYEDIIKNE